MNRQGVLLVVSGPSGVGKGTVIRRLMARRPELCKSVSCTTRDPRPEEEDGVDYHFMDVAEFLRLREAGGLLEWAVVHEGPCYGTPRGPVEAALAQGQDIILEIDYQGARSVRQMMGAGVALVFMAPPSWPELKARLKKRKTESPEDVRKRLRTARREFAHIDLFQYIVVNECVERAADELAAILDAERLRLSRSDWRGLQAEVLADAEADNE